jgi:hypothetical protein
MQLSCRDGEAGFVLVFVRPIQRITNAITRPVDRRNLRVDESDTQCMTPSKEAHGAPVTGRPDQPLNLLGAGRDNVVKLAREAVDKSD